MLCAQQLDAKGRLRMSEEEEGHRRGQRSPWLVSGDFVWQIFSVAMLWIVYVVLGVVRWAAGLRKSRKGRGMVARVERELQNVMEGATCYSQWYVAARRLDEVRGLAIWKREGMTEHLCEECKEVWNWRPLQRERARRGLHMVRRVEAVCDLDMISGKLNELAALYKKGDVKGLAFALRASLIRNLGGMCHPDLHAFSQVGTNHIVEDYVNVISYLLAYIAQKPTKERENGEGSGIQEDVHEGDSLSVDDKLTFLNEARHAYGRTALMLSGGAVMGLNHLGVVKGLLDQGLLPKIVCGTSAGALVASIVGIFDDEELLQILHTDGLISPITNRPFSFRYFDDRVTFMRRLKRFLKKGYIQDVKMLQDCLRKNYGDLTFEEAYNKTRRILNITVCPLRSSSDPPLLLNYLTAPHVLIWSAASASCALPLVFAPVELVTKSASGRLVPYHPDGVRWIDGSISSDVPLARIGELFNVNHFIVSQTNPHVIPRSMPILQTRLALLIKSEFQFRYWQALQMGLVPKLLTSIFPHFMQPYAGDVTIMPDIRVSDLTRLLSNPTSESIQGFIRRGEVHTFPFMDRIRLHCLIEQTLDRSVESVAAAAKGDGTPHSPSSPRRRNSLFGRVPSWLWLDARSILNSTAMTAMTGRFAKKGDDEMGSDSGDDRGEEVLEGGLSEKKRKKEMSQNLKRAAAADEILDDTLIGMIGETLSGEQLPDPGDYRFHGLSDDSEDSGEEDRALC